MIKFLEKLANVFFPKRKNSSNINKNYIMENVKRMEKDGITYFLNYRDEEVKKLIYAFKYENDKESIGIIKEILKPNIPKNTVIINVPSSNERKRKEGFNHMENLCKELAKDRCEYEKDVLIFKGKVKRQSTMESFKERHNNVYNKMRLRKSSSKNVLLLDDIFTSGAMIKEAKSVLNKSNIKVINIITIAH